MKITSSFFYKTFLKDINTQVEEMYRAQRQLSTGKRVLFPSDDPVAISRIVRYKSEISALDEYARLIDTAKIYNSSIESAINDLKGMVTKAKTYAVQGSTDTLSVTDRLAIAREIDTLIQRSLDTINTKVSGRYIFGGFKGEIAPVTESTGIYDVDTNIQYLDLNPFLDVAVNLPATEFFTYQVSSSISNRGIRVLTPYNQNFPSDPYGVYDADPLSALLMPPPSTVINNPANPFTTNGGTLTIQLGDKNPLSVTINANDSLNQIRDAINSQAGQYVKAWVVNTGTTTSPDYRLVIGSIPNGKSDKIRITVTQTTADNLSLLNYNPETGNVSMSLEGNISGYNYITDSTDPNYYSFNNNYLNENYYIRAFHFLKVALENNDQGRIQKAVDYLDKIADNLYKQQSLIGARINKIESITDYNLELKTNINQNLSNDQDADALSVISELNRRMTVLQAMRTTLTEFFKNNLFDFLR